MAKTEEEKEKEKEKKEQPIKKRQIDTAIFTCRLFCKKCKRRWLQVIRAVNRPRVGEEVTNKCLTPDCEGKLVVRDVFNVGG